MYEEPIESTALGICLVDYEPETEEYQLMLADIDFKYVGLTFDETSLLLLPLLHCYKLATSSTDHRLREMEKKIQSLENTISENHKSLEDLIKQQHNQIENQNKIIVELMAENKALMKSFLKQQTSIASLKSLFPIKSEDALKEVNSNIKVEVRDQYVPTISILLNSSVEKNLKNILDESVVLEYNVDGTYGKKRLKDYDNLYSVLLDAIPNSTGSPSCEDQLRKAIQLQKKRHFKAASKLQRNPLSNPQK
ncbi:uncharacterized protein LOC119688486 [Teleopsis dalmanni]|uniref:uncharacterized protein LOC119663642 n=1 Tax=Teleopsis dalmanni TaxID=139649 RepID=UPI0018CE41AB|nr:uncharacterized protein LOC119663642 [Teleopsis dalmanni]XP_037959090.1 uncharacterized protein LOC119688486 [Teleopsis dalmanni]